MECEACTLAKMKRQIRREPRELDKESFRRVAIDFYDFNKDLNYFKLIAIITDR